ncbi:MAG: hypothetical protein A3C08_03435 [Candidatus Taylorbacteria bacterium RIFCSPHIGHO2_02_FULL_47_18]|uniref:Metal-dependent hydrolase n=1 Tax=Candidatus Taylorbacteria bacterium RIFCSPLOWO2_01_FULL_48_100 TaxID=1802322 RepID=A0A1G2NFG2_9BACT|nr:MAG: hypothetical protein A3C08_03435 [Candidatus Taylorbacteria bacterium RIFCSPHIGHO2_02_FULL_47_18]OHA34803.1 MAG: hypothetical protein A2938_00020 [Candidatus Taylorbacteria bacterium RIFCSPLOWO2_01_FULL_48_100]OHA41114.1 MAG: hypothetical protein A3J31_03455 [Candidatus Taylorbacteria bacterium RIFCSPLOWO2_02_FULL_48_16]OHA45712.1 MAG: hypothetical protein A3H13_00410 [Candidatus Taylorbacteria bacterium RIFCSPLOWO2_12_FULL_48_11]
MKDSKKLIVTHDGGFHADDAFAVAALLLHLDGNADVVRSRNPKIIESGDFVVDVGGVYYAERNRFDHHQTGGAGMRENKIPYAAFGLVWKKFGATISGSAEIAVRIEGKLVHPIDAWDNGMQLGSYDDTPAFPYFLQNVVFAFEPTWNEKIRSLDSGFEEARRFASALLAREIILAKDVLVGEKLVLGAYEKAEDKRLIILDEKYEWEEILVGKPEPLFVILPDLRGDVEKWRAYAVRALPHSFTTRKPFPKEWAGLRDGELARASGVPDAVFCHNKLFTVAALTKEGAISLARKALAS